VSPLIEQSVRGNTGETYFSIDRLLAIDIMLMPKNMTIIPQTKLFLNNILTILFPLNPINPSQ
jgi:hypothetical protein